MALVVDRNAEIIESKSVNGLIRSDTTRWRKLVFEAAFVLVWIGGAAIALYFKRGQLLIGFDGGYMRDVAQRQFAWRVPLFSASIDLFQGLGDIFFSVINFRLFPEFIATSRFAEEAAGPVVTYVVILAEITLAVLFFGRFLGISRTISLAAAVLTCLVMLPFASPSLVYPILALDPSYGTIIAAALTMGGAFLSIGRSVWLADLAAGLLILALFVWWALADPTDLILGAPFLLLCGVSGVLAAASAGERWRKIVLFLGISVLLLTTGPVLYVVGVVLDTAAATFPLELSNSRADLLNASILFQWNAFGPTGPLLVGLAVAGAVVSILDNRRRTLRIFAITLLTYMGSRLTFAILVIVFDFWRGPVPLYFEFFVIPLYAIFAVRFLSYALDFARRSLGLRLPSELSAKFGLVAVGAIFAVACATATPSTNYAFPYPPKPTPFTELIARQAGMAPGTLFRGRTANLTGQTLERDINWFDLHLRDGALSTDLGNEMRVAGLHAFGIPSLFEYTPTITPAFYATTTRLLALPGDGQRRNVVVLRHIDLRVLAMLGVRYVIADAPVDSPATLQASLPTKNATLYLYEIANPNLGDYSPTIVRKAATAADIIALLAAAAFDPSREIVADLPETTKELSPATSARLTFDGVSLRAEAESSGRSILLLPLEFSNCLKIVSASSGEPLIFRADLLETGIIFSGRLDASLSIRTGPFFINPGCRLQDHLEMTALQISKVRPRTDPVVRPIK
jgi:hypothetical protein